MVSISLMMGEATGEVKTARPDLCLKASLWSRVTRLAQYLEQRERIMEQERHVLIFLLIPVNESFALRMASPPGSL